MPDRICIWIVEDDRAFQMSLLEVISLADGYECQQAFDSADALLNFLVSPEYADPSCARPDVLILDINMPGTNGLMAIEAIKTLLPRTAIVMLTIRDDSETIFSAFQRGASGYLAKSADVDQILGAIKEASRGGTLMPAGVARKVLAALGAGVSPGQYDLSKREVEVLREMTMGKSQSQIADALFVSRHTINTHIQHIYEKLHVHSGIQAVAKAIRERLV